MNGELTGETRKISRSNVSRALFGEMIAAFSLGAIYSIQLVLFGYYILVVSSLIIANFLKTNFMSWHKNTRVSYKTQVIGFSGGILLLLFLGIQSPQVPFTEYLFVIGVIFIIPALIDLLRGKKS